MTESGFVSIIKKIAGERGKDIFLHPKNLKPFLLDYAKAVIVISFALVFCNK
jgi:hypothetical protein